MEFRIDLPQTPDLARIAQLMRDEDPAAVFDAAPGSLGVRLSTVLNSDEVRSVFERAGLTLDAAQIRQLPSVCCGGCVAESIR